MKVIVRMITKILYAQKMVAVPIQDLMDLEAKAFAYDQFLIDSSKWRETTALKGYRSAFHDMQHAFEGEMTP